MTYDLTYDTSAGRRCTGRPAPGAVALRTVALEFFPTLHDLGIYNCRPVRGGSTSSRHGLGAAWDAGVRPSQRQAGDLLVALVVEQAPLLGVQSVIWYRRRWTAAGGWRPYSGVSSHTDHAHIELTDEAAASLTATAARLAFAPPPIPTTREDDDEMFLHVSKHTGVHLVDGGVSTWIESNSTVDELVRQGVRVVRTDAFAADARRIVTQRAPK